MRPVKVTTDDNGKTTCELEAIHRTTLADAKTITEQVAYYERGTDWGKCAGVVSAGLEAVLQGPPTKADGDAPNAKAKDAD